MKKRNQTFERSDLREKKGSEKLSHMTASTHVWILKNLITNLKQKAEKNS